MTTAESQDSNTNTATNTAKTKRALNIFEDPAIKEAARNDLFTRFLMANWRSLLMTVIAIGAGMIAYNVFTTTALQKRARATSLLADIQDSYKGLVDTQEKQQKLKGEEASAKSDDEKKKAAEALVTANKDLDAARAKINLMIESLDSPQPFDKLGGLYRGLVAGRFQDYALVEQTLSASDWEKIADSKSSDRFIAETITLGLAKSLAQSAEKTSVVKSYLTPLAERGSFVAVEAAAELSFLANNPEEQANLKQLIEKLRVKFPSQSGVLTEIAGIENDTTPR